MDPLIGGSIIIPCPSACFRQNATHADAITNPRTAISTRIYRTMHSLAMCASPCSVTSEWHGNEVRGVKQTLNVWRLYNYLVLPGPCSDGPITSYRGSIGGSGKQPQRWRTSLEKAFWKGPSVNNFGWYMQNLLLLFFFLLHLTCRHCMVLYTQVWLYWAN